MAPMSPRPALVSALLVAAGVLVAVPGPAHAEPIALAPFVDCVEASGDGSQLTAHFSWVSLYDTDMNVPFGTTNIMVPAPFFRGQPTSFPAKARGTVDVTFPATGYVEWTLGDTTARADASSPRCPYGTESVVTQPSVFGTLAVGRRVAVGGEQAKLDFDDYTVSYSWLRGCDEATPEVVGDQRAYDVTADDLGHRLQASVTYTRTSAPGSVQMTTPCDETALVGTAPEADTVPHVTGPLVVGGTLSLAGGSWSGTEPSTEAVRWESCDATACATVGSDLTYTTGPADLGRSVRAVVTRTNGFGTTSVTTPGVGPVVPEPATPAAPIGTLAPASLTFDATRVGASTGLSAVYVNDDRAPIRIAGVRITGEHAADFALGPGSCASGTLLAVGESCTLAVRFAPTAAGERRATLEVDDGYSRSVPLRGLAGAVPTATVVPVVVGEPRVGSELSLAGGEWGGSDPIATTVSWEACDAGGCRPAGAGPTYTPAPTDVGRGVRALVSATNAYGSTTAATAVAGPVRPAAGGVVAVSAHRLRLGAVTVGTSSRAKRLRISNTGDAPLQATLRMTGEQRSDFRWSSDCGPPVALAPGEGCTVTVRLHPARAGRTSATLLVASVADPAVTEAVRVAGRGVGRAP